MDPRKLTANEKQALTVLLDDPSPSVRTALLAQLGALGGEGREFLQAVAQGPDKSIATAAAWYLRELRFEDPVAEFRGFIRSLNYELETGAILLARTVNPGLDVVAVCTQLDALAARCRKLGAARGTMREQCQIINRVLFEDFGLRGNLEYYTDPRNSFIDQVLIRRTGIPISLAIVYLLVARRLGLDLEPVGAPGHFYLGAYEPEGPFYIDAFGAGRQLTPEQVFAALRQNQHDPQLADLAPTPIREVLCRCCRNLASHYAAAGQGEQSLLFASFVQEFNATYERHAAP